MHIFVLVWSIKTRTLSCACPASPGFLGSSSPKNRRRSTLRADLRSRLALFLRKPLAGPRDLTLCPLRSGAVCHRAAPRTGLDILRCPNEFGGRRQRPKKVPVPAVGILAKPCRRVLQVSLLEHHRARAAQRARLHVTGTWPCRSTSIVLAFLGGHKASR